MTETAIVPFRQRVLTSDVWRTITAIAPDMFKSDLFSMRSESQAAAIMVKGYELGLSLSASFEFIQVIQGKPGLSPRGMLALIHGHPDLAEMTISDCTDENGIPSYAICYMKRKNGFDYTATFSMEDAQRAGLIKADPRSGWEKYPANLLRWRAVGFCADIVFPDVLGGMKRTDELGAEVTPEGNTIEEIGQQIEKSKAVSSIPSIQAEVGPSAEGKAGEAFPFPKSHWIDRPEVNSKFWRWVGDDLALLESEVCEALNVSSIREYPGSMADCKREILKYVDTKATMEEETEEQGFNL